MSKVKGLVNHGLGVMSLNDYCAFLAILEAQGRNPTEWMNQQANKLAADTRRSHKPRYRQVCASQLRNGDEAAFVRFTGQLVRGLVSQVSHYSPGSQAPVFWALIDGWHVMGDKLVYKRIS